MVNKEQTRRSIITCPHCQHKQRVMHYYWLSMHCRKSLGGCGALVNLEDWQVGGL